MFYYHIDGISFKKLDCKKIDLKIYKKYKIITLFKLVYSETKVYCIEIGQ